MPIVFNSKWLNFIESQKPNPKTKIWYVQPKEDCNSVIGVVKWYGAWREYSFFPEPNCVFEKTCLRDIANFMEVQTKEHKDNKKCT